ncbi:hypothetical protein OAS39_13025 [Pirellulales bacterium]|nr:hypothetical protein [Pirellulales bacterium]
MASYLPHHTKKQQILSKKEAQLKRLILGDAAAVKLLAAAREVMDARIRVLQARRATIAPTAKAETQLDKLDVRIQAAKAGSLYDILEEFGCPITERTLDPEQNE